MKKLILIPIIAFLLSACHKYESLDIKPMSPTILDPREVFQTLPALPPFPQGTNFGVYYDTVFSSPQNTMMRIFLTYNQDNILEIKWPQWELKPGLGDLIWISLTESGWGADIIFYKNQSRVVATDDWSVNDIRIKDEVVYLRENKGKAEKFGYYYYRTGILKFL